jgi:P4 family phage/plasmid primase-like protien
MNATTSSPARPPSAHIADGDVENIPPKLREMKICVCWAWRWKPPKGRSKGKWDKPPIDPATGHEIDATDPANWMSFEDARLAARKHGHADGIGIAMGSKKKGTWTGLVGVDPDHCIDEKGNIHPDARRIVDSLDSYTERTPSGKGLRVLLVGEKPGPRCKNTRRDIEIYDADRYFTLTGRHLDGTPTNIRRNDEALKALYDELFPPDGGNHQAQANGSTASLLDASDDALIERARHARNGARFTALFDRGDISAYNDDDSAADMALANMLAFWTGRDASRMETLFGRSALGQRDKWKDRGEYRKWTIDEAIAGCKEVYTPTRPPGDNGRPSTATAADDSDVNEGPEDPHRLARLHLARVKHIRFYRGEWLQHDGSAYRAVKDSELHSGLAGTIKREFNRLNRIALRLWEEAGEKNGNGKPCDKPEARTVTRTLVSNATLALQSMSLLPGKTEAPSWLGSKAPFPPAEVVPTRSTLVHLPTRRTVRSTADFFATYALEFDFNPAAAEPAEWLKFLDSLWTDDRQSIDTLQEWFGYCLAPDTRHQKILSLIGPKRAGKDTIARVLTHLVGVENTAGPTLASLASDFGLAPLIGKPLAIISDARITRGTNTGVIVERLLTISGEGWVTIDRKYLETWTGKLPTRFVLISNELPRLVDASAALAGRLILLRLTKSFYGAEDLGLFDRLLPELPGIFLWACKGWERLRERGALVQPQTGVDLIENLEELSSPVLAFVRERCGIEKIGLEVECKALFDAWCEWCKTTGWRPGTPQSFAKDLRAACPLVSTKQTQVGGREGNMVRFYKGIDLRNEF